MPAFGILSIKCKIKIRHSIHLECTCSSDPVRRISVQGIYPFETGYLFWGIIANSEESVQTRQLAASDQDLHCLLTRFSVQNIVKVKIFTRKP